MPALKLVADLNFKIIIKNFNKIILKEKQMNES